MPKVLRIKLTINKIFNLTFVKPANIITPSSSGRGDAIIIPISAYSKHIFILLPKLLSSWSFISRINFVFLNLLNSFSNETLIELKISKSEYNAPNPPMIPAIKIFSGFKVMKNPAAKGAVKPNAKSNPAIKIPRYFKLPNPDTKYLMWGFLKIR